jgi:hypothetical protein
MSLRLVDIERLRSQLPDLRKTYADAAPFPHVVIDDVLTPEAFRQAVAEFPAIRDASWKGYLHVNETKYANPDLQSWQPSLQAIAQEFLEPEFVEYLTELTGIGDLIPDASMDGGGLHQTLRGGHLNVHADFTTHHTHADWARRVNILLYLNDEWRPEWGGELELWDVAMTGCHERVTPQGNRMLVFTTSADSFHGHPDPLTCPDDVARRSMALYYFTREHSPVRRSTNYRARPGDGLKRVAIWTDRTALDLYDRTRRRLGWSDERANAVLERISRLRGKRR